MAWQISRKKPEITLPFSCRLKQIRLSWALSIYPGSIDGYTPDHDGGLPGRNLLGQKLHLGQARKHS